MAAAAAAAAALSPVIFSQGFRFDPTAQEAVTYYLPRLASGDPLALPQLVRSAIHFAQVHACDPADLARRFRPMPRTHNRFFFAAVSRGVRARARPAAGPGSWSAQSTVGIMDEDEEGDQKHKIGELRKFRYKKRRGVFTDWLMEEYSSCAAAAGGGVQPVLCKVYVSPKAAPNSDAFRESAACFATPSPAAPAAITQAAKRPALPPSQDVMSQCAKRMRSSSTTLQPAAPGSVSLPPPPPPPQPSVLPAAPPPRAPLAAVRKIPVAPPQPPCVPRRGSTAPSAPPLAPAAPTQPPRAAVQRMLFAPPQAPSALPLAPPVLPTRGSPMPCPPPPRPLAQPKKKAPSTTTPVAVPPQAPVPPPRPPRLPIQSKQRTTIPDPFEVEEQTVAAAPATLQDDDFAKELEDMLSSKEEERGDDDFAKALEEALEDVL